MADPIEHVIVLMMENRSFDQMLGYLKTILPGLEGIDPAKPLCNPEQDPALPPICQKAEARDITDPDPKHEVENVLQQLDVPGHSQGFVQDYVASHADKPNFRHDEVMCYFPQGSLGALHTLAESFCVCDHWFSSLPGPTWPNRFFVTTGTSLGHIDMPEGTTQLGLHIYDQDTIFTQLGSKGKNWAIYHGDFPQTLLLTRLWLHPFHFHALDKFFQDAQGKESDFPAFSFLEPIYFNTNGDQNDQHPPTSVFKGEELIAQVYNAIRGNDALWKKSLLIVMYDEHGGFADHVWTQPGDTVPPDGNTQTFAFDRFGVRVPTVLISPWIDKGFDSTVYDHTSLLKYLANKWGVDELGNRTKAANSFGQLLAKRATPRDDTPASVAAKPAPAPAAAARAAIVPPPPEQMNEHQRALYAFSVGLEQKMADVESAEQFRTRAFRATEGPRQAGGVATERANRYLDHLRKGKIRVK